MAMLDKNSLHQKALKIGRAGYFFYSPDSSEFEIFGDFLFDNLTQSELETIKKRGFWPLIAEEERSKIRSKWNNCIMDQKAFSEITRISTERKGDLWVRFHTEPKQGAFACFFVDVTEQIETQLKLTQAKQALEKTLREKNYLLGRISHEIRTPMNAVIGIADALVYQNIENPIKSKLELIQSSADNILRILDRTLDATKLDAELHSLSPSSGDPADVVRKVCELWADKAKSNSTSIVCHIEENVPNSINFDKHRYEQCLNNLISNAVKFTKDGTIGVVLTVMEKVGQQRLVLAVKDTGIGMSASQQAKVFDAFQQADTSISSRFGGTGLGMNITKQLAELMDGNISVRSEEGKGSTFVLWIPVESGDAEDNPISTNSEHIEGAVGFDVENLDGPMEVETTVAMEEPPLNLLDQVVQEFSQKNKKYERLKVLIADDNPTNHVVVQSILEGTVGEIYTADNGQEVLDILSVQDIDIILMDIHMPVMDGIETTLAIRASDKPWKDVSIIALTADPQYQQKRVCLNIGMNEALGKPVKVAEILAAFDTVLDEKLSNSEPSDISIEIKEAV